MMTRMMKCAAVLIALATVVACDPDESGISGVTLPINPEDPDGVRGFAVTHTDYDAAGAIAIVGFDGELLRERFVHSGTVFEGLGGALSSDVVLPTVHGPSGVLTYIERLGTNLVTRIDLAAGEVLGQTLTDASATDAFQSNPYDVVFEDDASAWITRYAPNTEVDDTDANAGNDMVLVNLDSGEISDERISFSDFNATAIVTDMDTGDESEVVVYARPGRMVKVGDHAIVTLDMIDLSFSAYGDGMIAFVDLEAKTAQGITLAGLKNCGGLEPVADDATRVVVSCVGDYADALATSGIAIIVVEDGEATVEHTWIAAEHVDDAIATSNVVSLGGTRVVGIATGNSYSDPPTVDRAYVLDVESGAMDELAESEGAYVLGAGAYNAASKLLLLPDASADEDGVVTAGLRRFQWDADGDVSELDMIDTDSDLPPRTVAALR